MSDEVPGAICNLLEHNPTNPELADKISKGICPKCGAEAMVPWCPGRGFHDLCTHYHCVRCDTDYCWPIAWDPPMPITEMKGELTPSDRRQIAESAERQGIKLPGCWQILMVKDKGPHIEKAALCCYKCKSEKEVEVLVQDDHWRWPRGKWPRGWSIDEEEELSNGIIYGVCDKHSLENISHV